MTEMYGVYFSQKNLGYLDIHFFKILSTVLCCLYNIELHQIKVVFITIILKCVERMCILYLHLSQQNNLLNLKFTIKITVKDVN